MFLCHMLQDLNLLQTLRTAAMLDSESIEVFHSIICYVTCYSLTQEGHISSCDLSLEKIWNLYIPLSLR